MAVIIANVVSFMGIKGGKTVNIQQTYTDYDEFSTQYVSKIKTVVELGIMSGQSKTIFDSQGVTTRAQAAQIQRMFLSLIK